MPDRDFDTVSFDCYGTLVDWETGIAHAFMEAAAEDGVDLDPESVLRHFMELEPKVQAGPFRTYRDVLSLVALQVAGRVNWQLAPEDAGFLADSLPEWPVFADTRDALARLAGAFELGIASNVDDDLLQATLQRIGVRFDWTVTAQQVRSYKPGHQHFEQAIRYVRGRRDRLVHAAQSLFHDVRPASELGLTVVWVNRKREVAPEGLRPAHTVDDLTGLADWLAV